jgi:preprotein translocase subunit SecE
VNKLVSCGPAGRKEVERVFVSNLTIAIWVVVIGSVFAYLWWQGHIRRFATYIQETREELKKCTWPTWDELKGSTVLITITIFLMGGFVRVVDMVLVFILLKH